VEREYDAVGELCLAAGATEVYVADNPTTSERIWRVRRNIAEAYSVISPRQSSEDIVVPPAAIPLMVAKFKQMQDKYGLLIPSYGHAGDGNLHTRIAPPADWPDSRWREVLDQALDELYRFTAEVGGRISGEHGIGHKRKAYMPYVVSEDYLNMLRAIKRALDPNNILNPGKIFDL
jgi:glycolate oxidase